jgi:hypothetical protein
VDQDLKAATLTELSNPKVTSELNSNKKPASCERGFFSESNTVVETDQDMVVTGFEGFILITQEGKNRKA